MKRYAFLLAALASVPLFASQVRAAAVGSPYYNAMLATSPGHYYPLTESYGSDPLTTAVQDLGSLAGSSTAQYIGNTPNSNAGYNLSLSATDGTGPYSTAFIGGNIGPYFPGVSPAPYQSGVAGTNDLGNGTAAVARQLPGFAPYYGDYTVASNTITGYNRVFEPNLQGALKLGATNTTFLGDPTTGAFSFAGWISAASDGVQSRQNSAGVYLFDSGQRPGDPGFFQAVLDGYGGVCISTPAGSQHLTPWYPSGNPPSANGVDIGPANGSWRFVAISYSGTTAAQPQATVKLWYNGYLTTGNLPGTSGAHITTALDFPSSRGIPKVGYQAATVAGGLGPFQNWQYQTAALQESGNKIGDIATWNSALNYAQMESLYVAAVTPLSGGTTNTGTPTPPVNSTSNVGGWAGGVSWSAGQYPLAHGNELRYYYDVQLLAGANVTAGGGGNGGYNDDSKTLSYRSDMYRMSVASGGTLNLQKGATLRTYENANIQGKLNLNGDAGFESSIDGWTKQAMLDIGQSGTLGSTSVVTFANPYSQIVAHGNLTIQSGGSLNFNLGSGSNTTGPQLWTIIGAGSSLGSGGMGVAGSLSGTFGSNVALSLSTTETVTQRRMFLVYAPHNAHTGGGADYAGTGAIDSVMVGLAQPGDANLDGKIDIKDVQILRAHFNQSGNWLGGDFDRNGTVNTIDRIQITSHFNTSYSAPTIPEAAATLNYDSATGNVTMVLNAAVGSLVLTSSSGLLQPDGWLGPAAGWHDGVTLDANTIGFDSSLDGNDFTIGKGYDLGRILPPGLDRSQLASDLMVNYITMGSSNILIGSVVPEPSTLGLSIAATALAGSLWARRNRKSRRVAERALGRVTLSAPSRRLWIVAALVLASSLLAPALSLAQPMALSYDPTSGQLMALTYGATIDSLAISSVGGNLIPGGWTAAGGPAAGTTNYVTLTNYLIGFDSSYNLDNYVVTNNKNLGVLLPAGWSSSLLNSDISFTYFQTGQSGVPYTQGTLSYLGTATNFVWSGTDATAPTSWNATANWSPYIPGSAGQSITLGNAGAGGILDLATTSNQTVGNITFHGNTNTLVRSNSGGALYLDNRPNNPSPATVSVSGSNTISADVRLYSNLVVNDSGSLSLTGNVTQGVTGRGITLNGNGLLVLAKSGGYTGPTTVSGGTLQVGTGGSGEGLASAAIVADGALVFSHSDALTVQGSISGSGQLVRTGSGGRLTLVGANTFGGNATVNGGTLQIGDGATAGAALPAATISNSGALVFDLPDMVDYSGSISGPGSLLVQGSGTLALSNSNNYTGSTTVTGGATLTVTTPDASGLRDGSALNVGDLWLLSQLAPVVPQSAFVAAAAAPASVPEPATWMLFAPLAAAGLIGRWRRRGTAQGPQ